MRTPPMPAPDRSSIGRRSGRSSTAEGPLARDYHDYVIKDGRLVGEFDRMYRECDDPCHQSRPEHHRLSIPRLAAIAMMQQRQVRTVTEWGSGLGYFTEQLAAAGFEVTGIDVARAAVDRATARRPDLRFAADTAEHVSAWPADAIVFAQLTWFILPQLRGIFDALLADRPARYFVLIQTFYAPGVQQYGTEYFTSLGEYVQRCPLRLLQQVEATSGEPGAVTETCALFAVEPKG